MSGAIGMMNEGYFVGRKELINWIRQNFDSGFNKIEDLASGVVYCQIVDSIYAGVVPMSKVKMTAKTEVDFIHNFKILQTAFSKKKIDRYIDVDKLSKKSFQYNMEFVQFMKCYWDMHAPNGGGGAVFQEAPINEPPIPQQAARKPVAAQKRSTFAASSSPAAAHGSARAEPRMSAGAPRMSAGAAGAASEQLVAEVAELKLSVDNLERERDFYYTKLREVEVLCQGHENEDVPFLQDVLAILYKTDDDDFVSPVEG